MTDEQLKAVIAGEFTLDVPNFKKWNPDRRHRTWIALDKNWQDDPKVHPLPPTARLLFLTCLSLTASSLGPSSKVTATLLRARSRLTGASVEPLILKLVKSGLISIECSSLQTDIQTGIADAATAQDVKVPVVLAEIETSVASDYLQKIPIEKQQALVTQFGANRVKNAAMDAAEWCRSKGKRGEKKNWGQFLTNWLKREQVAPVQAPSAPKQTVSKETFEGLFK